MKKRLIKIVSVILVVIAVSVLSVTGVLATAPTNQNSVFYYTSTQYKQDGGTLAIHSSVSTGGSSSDTVWLAPSGTTIFTPSATITNATGSATSMTMPATDGNYYLWVENSGGEFSAQSTHYAIADSTPPTISVSAPSLIATSNTNVTYTVTYYDLYFNLCSLSTGNVTLNKTGTANGTKAVSGSGATRTVTISGITGDGTLSISIATHTASDFAGNLAPAAGPSVTFLVENTAPSNQDAVFTADVSQASGTAVAINSSASTGGDATDNVWFAPSGTTVFIAGSTMTTASGSATSINAPATAGTYYLYVVDAVGLYSSASTAALTVTGGATYAISNSASTYTLNSDNSGSGIVLPNTTYYSNPLGSTTSPTVGGATDAQCEWTLTNTSTAAIDLTCLMSDYSGGGSASTNSNNGTNGATSYGAKSYFSGQASGSWVVIKTAGSSVGYSNLAANTNIKWGFLELTQTNYGSSATGSTSILLITATAH